MRSAIKTVSSGRRLPALLLALSTANLPACSLVKPPQRQAPTQTQTNLNLEERRADLFDVYDDLVLELSEAVARIEATDQLDTEQLAELYGYRYSIAHGASLVAASPNPVVGLVDLTVIIELQRRILDERSLRSIPQSASKVLLEAMRRSEARVAQSTRRVLEPQEIEIIENLADQWMRENPERVLASHVRLADFSAQRRRSTSNTPHGAGSLFRLLRLDPLAGLDPATREIEESRLFAERALFLAERAPILLGWQMQWLYLRFASRPHVEQVLADLSTFSEATRSAGQLADSLPRVLESEREAIVQELSQLVEQQSQSILEDTFQKLATEREAAINQTFDQLKQERQALIETLRQEDDRLNGTLAELRSTIHAGESLSASTRELVLAADTLARHVNLDLGPDEPGEEDPGVEEYRALLEQATSLVNELRQLLVEVDQAATSHAWTDRLDELDARLATAEQSGARLVDRLFWRALILLALALAGFATLSYARGRWWRAN